MDPNKPNPEGNVTPDIKEIFQGAEGENHHLRAVDLMKLSIRVFRTRPMRTFLTTLGISLGVGVVLFLVSLGYGLQYTLIGRLVTTQDSLITIEAYYPSDSAITIGQNVLDKINTFREAQTVSTEADFPAEIKEVQSANSTSSNIVGYAFARLVKHDYFRLSGVTVDTGKLFTNANEGFIISSAALKVVNLQNKPNDFQKDFTIKLLYPLPDGTTKESLVKVPMKIVGIVNDDVQPPFIILPEELVADPPPYYQRVLVKSIDAAVIESLRDKLVNLGFLVSTHIDLVNQAQKVLSIVTIILGVFGITALIVSAIGMFNTMVISFLERTFEVGIMKAIGATNRDIRNLFLMESLLMGILGGLGGVLIGTVLGEGANLGLNLLAKSFGGKPVQLFVRPLWFEIVIIAASGFIGIFSGFWPARRATHISPKEAFLRK